MKLSFGFTYRLSAAIIDLAIWFVIIGIFSYLFPGTGILVGFVVLSVILSFIDKKLGDKTIGQTILGLESKKEVVAYEKSPLDRLLKLAAWFIPLSYFIQPFWIKILQEKNTWYDKALGRKIILTNNLKVSKLSYAVLIILAIATVIAVSSYFVILPF